MGAATPILTLCGLRAAAWHRQGPFSDNGHWWTLKEHSDNF